MPSLASVESVLKIGARREGPLMNINEFINQLTQGFDFSMHMVINHPLLSVTGALIAFLFYEVLSTLKFIGAIISIGIGLLMATLFMVLSS